MIATVRIACLGWGLLSLLLAFMCFTALSMLGFPDGYISPYDSSTRTLQEVMAWLLVIQSAYFLFTGFVGTKLRAARLAVQVLLIVAFIVVPIGVVETCPRWTMCARAYQTITGNFMDDGTGG